MVACLCPTYKRPDCLAASVAMWLNQDYPFDRRRLLIVDDAGQFDSVYSDSGWSLTSLPVRCRSLQEKFNLTAKILAFDADVLMPWEDDDIYLPWHVTSHVTALQSSGASWSRPSRVLTKVGNASLQVENALGRMHGSWAFTARRFRQIGGYDESFDTSQDQGFDLDLGRRLSDRDNWWDAVDGSPCDPLDHGPISYVYHWGPAPYHGSGFGAGFYEKAAEIPSKYIGRLVPKMDLNTQRIYEKAMEWQR